MKHRYTTFNEFFKDVRRIWSGPIKILDEGTDLVKQAIYMQMITKREENKLKEKLGIRFDKLITKKKGDS